MGPLGIAELIVNGDNAFHMPGLAGDVAAEDNAVRGAGQRDDAVFDGHREAAPPLFR
jgi:hypothetical protein